MTDRAYSEDIIPGTVVDLGSYQVSAAEVDEFSSRWDPLSMHNEGAAALSGHFEGSIASGIQSVAILQRLAVLGLFGGWAVLAGRRLRDVSFDAPVRPGMTLTAAMTVDAVVHRNPQRSLVTVTGVLRHDGTQVLSAIHDLYVWRRPST